MNFYHLAWCFWVTFEQQWIILLSERLSAFRWKDFINRHPSSFWNHKLVLMQQSQHVNNDTLRSCFLTGWDVHIVTWISEDRKSVRELRFILQQHSFSVSMYDLIDLLFDYYTKHGTCEACMLSLTVTYTPSDLCAVSYSTYRYSIYILEVLLVFSKLPSLHWHQCSAG